MTDAHSLAARLFAVIDGQRWEEYESVMHPDVEFSNPFTEVHGVSEWVAFNRAFAAAMPDGRHTVEDVLQDGDRFAARLTFTGTHTGPLATPQGQVPPTGRTVALPLPARDHPRRSAHRRAGLPGPVGHAHPARPCSTVRTRGRRITVRQPLSTPGYAIGPKVREVQSSRRGRDRLRAGRRAVRHPQCAEPPWPPGHRGGSW